MSAAVDRGVLAESAAGGTVGQVPGLRLVISDTASGTALAEFAMTAASETAFLCGELYRRGDGWKFRAVGQGYATGLSGNANDFGASVGRYRVLCNGPVSAWGARRRHVRHTARCSPLHVPPATPPAAMLPASRPPRPPMRRARRPFPSIGWVPPVGLPSAIGVEVVQ